MVLAALYARVSTEEQAIEGYSIDAQKDLLSNYCVAQDYGIFKIYVDDGFSGRSDKRPAYREMMAEMDEWDVMVVLKMDRIHRNSRNFMNMMDELGRHGKQFISATENLDTTNAMGKFVMSMIQSIAQLESEQIGERTYVGMREKAETMRNTPQGSRTLGFNPPYGYLLDGGRPGGAEGGPGGLRRISRREFPGEDSRIPQPQRPPYQARQQVDGLQPEYHTA